MGQQRAIETLEKLLFMAHEALEQSYLERELVRIHYINIQMYEAEMAQHKSDKYYGYAQGICQTLIELDYKHEGIERLYELLK